MPVCCHAFCPAASESVISIYTAELFPTSVRSSAMGICSQVRTNGLLSPSLCGGLSFSSTLHVHGLVCVRVCMHACAQVTAAPLLPLAGGLQLWFPALLLEAKHPMLQWHSA
jgi:hypothetical protein